MGLDILNAYHDVTLKKARLARLMPHPGFSFVKLDLGDSEAMAELRERIARVIHGAQAGCVFPQTLNVLEGCSHSQVGQLVYASTRSVYSAITSMPYLSTTPPIIPCRCTTSPGARTS